MVDPLSPFFSGAGFMPHGHCFLWTPGLLWTYVLADSIIALSYYSIPLALWYFARKRSDLPFRWMFSMFAVFVLACGTTHVLSIWNIWQPDYWLDAALKAVTAAASIATALLLWPLIPRALALPSPRMLEEANRALENEVAERREAEQSLRARTQALEALNRELDSFSYSASHDLRAPLRAIDGFASLLQRSAQSKLNDDERDHLDRIRRGSQQMGRLIEDLLRLSKLSRTAVEPSSVDLGQLAAELIERYCEEDSARRVHVKIAGDLDVWADPALARLMLDNLLSNAWKFTRRTADAHIELGSFANQGEQIFFVRDNGAGFDAEYSSKLFRPFERLHRQDEFEGTGVGLTIVARVVETHGGRVWAESIEKHGATFYFTLAPRVIERANFPHAVAA